MSRPSLRSMMRQPRRQGQHRRIRRLELRADDADAERATQREEIRAIKAALLVMGAPLDGEIPAELTCAITSGRGGQVTLDVAGQPVLANLDPDQPGDVVEIWRAIKDRVGAQAAS
jgi:hypothetical protein